MKADFKISRTIDKVLSSHPTIEGAGVKLKRAFGPEEVRVLDPFLLLDDFHSTDPADYVAGFPFHPHRGIETVTYMIKGSMEHGDNLGNRGVIGSGDVQWMTAGSGIIHQEMPLAYEGGLWGLQLWINMPSSEKMSQPAYRNIKNDAIPRFNDLEGVEIKLIAGSIDGMVGPVQDMSVDVRLFDVNMVADRTLRIATKRGDSSFAYILDGDMLIDGDLKNKVSREMTAVFSDGDELIIRSGPNGAWLVLASGRPIRESVAWGGPVVMNSKEEVQEALREIGEGTFIKQAPLG